MALKPNMFFFSSFFCFFIASYLKILLLRQHIYILRRIIFFIYFTCCGVFLNRFDCGWFIRIISQEKKINFRQSENGSLASLPWSRLHSLHELEEGNCRCNPQAECHCFLMSWSGSSEGSSENGSWANPKKWLEDV